MELFQDFKMIDYLALLVSVIALIVSCIALLYTILTFLLKSGHKLRCDIVICSSIDCTDKFISGIILENLKDRATVIFAIYLQLGRGNYIVIESFDNDPLILKPFEVYRKEYEPLLMYISNSTRIKLNKLLSHSGPHKVLISTTDGQYEVKANTKRWDPTHLFFKNVTTAIVEPKRLSYKGKHYGENIKFLVDVKKTGLEDVVIALRPGDYERRIFTSFSLTEDCLKSKEKLDAYLKVQKEKGNLPYDEIKIIDFQARVSEIIRKHEKESIELIPRNYFEYNILGRLYTMLENWKLKKKNKANKNHLSESEASDSDETAA
jgi:hypothetical protein